MEGTLEAMKLVEARGQRTREGEYGSRGVTTLASLPTWALAAALAAATLGVYGTTLRNGFVDFDDREYITKNVHVQAGLTWTGVKWAFRSLDAANWHPLTWISHMADCQMFGLNPAGHHGVSMLLHVINVVLLFVLLYKGTGYRWRSFFVAGLFALHPLNVETVAWASERKSLLSMLFSLLAVGCYGWYAQAPQVRRYLAVAGCFALALLAKPMAVTLPVVLLILDYWPLERMPIPFSKKKTDGVKNEFWKRFGGLVAEKIPLFLMTAASSWVTVIAQERGHATSSMGFLTTQLRLQNAFASYAEYIGKMFWPSKISYYYPHPVDQIAVWKFLLAAFLLAIISDVVWQNRERRHLLSGWALFVMTLVPVIGVIQVGMQARADRYVYIPFIGLFIAIIWELNDRWEQWCASKQVRQGMVVSLIGMATLLIGSSMGAATVKNIGHWRDSVSLFTNAHKVILKPNIRIEMNLAAALKDQGRTAEAIEHFRIAESLAPGMFIPHFNIGYALAESGDDAGALPELKEAVRCASNPEEKARALNRLAVAYLDLGKNEESAAAFSELLKIQPQLLAGRAGRGQALFNLARYEEASTDFVAAAEVRPAGQLFLMAGKSLEGAGKFMGAAEEYRRALKTEPGLAEARTRLDGLEKKLASCGKITADR
jgi:Flp pilus assembly protein TadD